VQVGPAITWVRSITLSPASGPVGRFSAAAIATRPSTAACAC
jgi:hypothetical protein